MASSSLLGMVDLYLAQKNELTYQATDILMQITAASRQESTLSTETETKKESLSSDYKNGSIDQTSYESTKDSIESEFEAKLSVINTWEKELDMKKSNIEQQEQECQAYQESYQSALKQNVQKDFKYAQN